MAFAGGSEAYKLGGDVFGKSTRAASKKVKRTTKPQASQVRQVASVAVCIAFIFAMAVLYVAQHAQMALLGDEVYQAQKSLKMLKAENEHLELELMRLSSLSRVEGLARTAGKMVEPGRIQYVAKEKPPVQRVNRTRTETLRLDVQRLAKPAHVTSDR